MPKLFAYILFFSLLLLAACDSDKNAFMTPKPYEPVVDVGVDEYSVNGTVVGNTATDISVIEAIDDVFDNPLHYELREIRAKDQENALRNGRDALCVDAKLHVDGDLSYGDFFKTFLSMRSSGYAGFKLVIGSNYKDVFQLDYPISFSPMPDLCYPVISDMKSLRFKKLLNHQKLSLDEVWDKDIEKRKNQIECVKGYSSLDLLLHFYRYNDGYAYLVSLNETSLNNDSLFQGYKYYTFYNEADLWKFIENVRSKVESKNGDRRDRVLALLDGRKDINLVLKKDIPMKDVVPVIKKLNEYGYRLNFANFE